MNLIKIAWSRGNLSYKVQAHQQELWESIKAIVNEENPVDCFVLNCSRRFGKSTLSFLALVEKCLKEPSTSYLFCAPTEGNAKEIILDIAPVILEDAPDEFKPTFKNNRYTFPNGSEIRIGGAYNGGETLRGRSAHGAVVDEAAFIKQTSPANGLKYILDSIIRPQLLTTRGFLLVSSTPPPVLTHDYVDLFNKMDLKRRTATFTVEQNSSINAEFLETLKASYYESDPTGSSWRREFRAEFVRDERQLIIPNWGDEYIVDAYPRPDNFEQYQRIVSYDHGTSDLSVFLFGWYDFPEAKLVIEHSLVIDNYNEKKSTSEISQLYKTERDALWPNLSVMKEICDAINPQVIIDFNRQFGHRFVPPSKSNREAMVNQVVNMVQAGRIVVVNNNANRLLLKTLESGVWNSTSTTRDFSRQPGIGHCDAIAALMYMVRGISLHHNPTNYRPALDFNQLDFRPPAQTADRVLAKAFGLNRKH